jgi:hypothetical protein
MSLETHAGREKAAELEVKKPETWYVYTYAFPDDTVFYVGKGKNGRINVHEDEAAKGCECRKCIAIRKVWASGSPVRKRIVFETFVESEALAKELDLIKEYSGEYLTNAIYHVGFMNAFTLKSDAKPRSVSPAKKPLSHTSLEDDGWRPYEDRSIVRVDGFTLYICAALID